MTDLMPNQMNQTSFDDAETSRWSDRNRLAINKRLDERLGDDLNQSPLLEPARYSLLAPGKRFRPLLVLACASIFHADPLLALDPACAIEMVHAYSLIHDDLPCLDNDDLRRGRPTLHKIFPEAIALLTGNALLTLAFEMLSQAADLSLGQQIQLIQILSHAAGAQGMMLGQAIDISAMNSSLDEHTLLKMHSGKTAALFIASLQFGAVIAGAYEMLPILKKLGSSLGLAYQFYDDLLDATSSQEILRKNVRRDAAQKKQTAISFYGIEGTKKKLSTFFSSIEQILASLPNGAPRIKSLICQNLAIFLQKNPH